MRPKRVGTASAGERHMMLVPEKSHEGTSTAPRSPEHRGKDGVDIFGGDQRDVRQQRAYRARTLRNQRGGCKRDCDVKAARIFLVDSERAGRPRHREQAASDVTTAT